MDVPRLIVAMGCCLLCMASCLRAPAQSPPAADPGITTLHTGTSLTLVDVIAEQTSGALHTRQLLTALKQTDFRLFDDNHEVPLRSFDVGVEETTRPIALWLVVQCNMGFPIGWSSGFMRDQMHLLQPAFAALKPEDVIGVAHWCDDGVATVDLAPQKDAGAALRVAEAVLHAPVQTGQDRLGELALQRLINAVLAETKTVPPRRLPVFLFLYGDHSATYVAEAEEIIKSLLESSGIVFGLNTSGSEAKLSENLGGPGQVSHLIHHYAAETGGQFYSTADPRLLASALAYTITQVHLRYVLGFEPARLDGRRHELRVELTKAARKVYAGTDLRFRTEYIPVASPH